MYPPGPWTNNQSALRLLTTINVFSDYNMTNRVTSMNVSGYQGTVRSGVRTSGWPLPERAIKPVNAASRTDTFWEVSTSHFWGSNAGARRITGLAFLPGGYPSHLAVNQDLNEMKRRFYNSVRGVQWNAMMTFAEGKESIGTLRSLCQTLLFSTVAFVDARRGSLRGLNRLKRYLAQPPARRSAVARAAVKQHAKDNADRWLEYSYGIAPTLGDIGDAREALSNDITYRRDRARGSLTNTTQNRSETVMYADNIPFLITTVHSTKTSVKGFGLIASDSAGGAWDNASANLGFSWSNVIPTVYELIPYSFVVDYFTNLGDVITAASTPLQNVTAMGTTVVSESFITHTTRPAPGVQVYTPYPPGRISCKYFTFSRTPGSVGLPTLEFKVPARDSLKWLNLSALATSKLL